MPKRERKEDWYGECYEEREGRRGDALLGKRNKRSVQKKNFQLFRNESFSVQYYVCQADHIKLKLSIRLQNKAFPSIRVIFCAFLVLLAKF